MGGVLKFVSFTIVLAISQPLAFAGCEEERAVYDAAYDAWEANFLQQEEYCHEVRLCRSESRRERNACNEAAEVDLFACVQRCNRSRTPILSFFDSREVKQGRKLCRSRCVDMNDDDLAVCRRIHRAKTRECRGESAQCGVLQNDAVDLALTANEAATAYYACLRSLGDVSNIKDPVTKQDAEDAEYAAEVTELAGPGK